MKKKDKEILIALGISSISLGIHGLKFYIERRGLKKQSKLLREIKEELHKPAFPMHPHVNYSHSKNNHCRPPRVEHPHDFYCHDFKYLAPKSPKK